MLGIDPRNGTGQEPILRRREEDAGGRHHRAVQRAERADRNGGRDDDDADGTDHELCHVRGDQLGMLHLLNRNEIEIHQIRAEVEHHDGRGADQQRTRQRPLRMEHFATDEREISPAVVRPQNRHHGEQKWRQPHRGALREDAAGREVRRLAPQGEPYQDQRRERPNLEDRAQVLEHRATMDAKEIHRADEHDISRAEELLGADIERAQAGDYRRGIVAERPQRVR